MGLALMLAVAFIYIVLASQFESFLEPFLIMLSLPLALVGALLALLLTGQQPRHAGDDRRGHADGPGDEERDPARRLHQPATSREGLSRRRTRSSRPGPIRLRPILMTTLAMILGMLPSAMGTRRRRRVPRADFDCDHRRPDHLDAADAGRRAGRRTCCSRASLERVKAWRAQPAPRLHPAVRVAGVVLLVALVGWFLSATQRLRADAADREPLARAGRAAAAAPLTLTFDQALERALAANEGLKVVAGAGASRARRACRRRRPTSCRR